MNIILMYKVNDSLVISARDLSNELGLRESNFSKWFEQQTSIFVENQEFGVFILKDENPLGGRPQKNYWLTLDTAKHIALMSRTEKGREYRTRLIQLEKEHSAPKQEQLQNLPQVEDYIKGADLLAGIFKVEGAEKIKLFDTMLSPFPSAQKALPSYNSNVHVGTVGQVNERVAHAYSFHKKENEIPLSAQLFNKLLVIDGFLSEEVTSSGRKFKAVTEKGLEFGKNVVAKQSSTSTQPHWYDDTIMELYEIINPTEDETMIG